MKVCLLLGLCLATTGALSAGATAQEKPTFSSKSELVVLHATVEDKRGVYISGLKQDEFIVLDDGRPQELQFFSAADTPATVGLIVDNSTSMHNKRDLVVAAAVGFSQKSNPEDEMFVLAFNENVSEIWRPQVIGLSNVVSMHATLISGIAARGKTALYDALLAGLERLEQGKHTRQVLVVISDGDDNASSATLEQVLDRMRGSEAAIFTVMLKDPIANEGNPKLLKRLAHETGGESFEPDRVADIPETLEHIARDIRSAYTLGFVPAEGTDRALRKLKVNVRTKTGRTFEARTRGGYAIRGTQ